MNKATKISKTLNEHFGDQRQDVRVVMPKAFLANLSKELGISNNLIAEAVSKNNTKEEMKTLIADNLEMKKLLVHVEDAIRESRVDQVEILNLPKQKEIIIPEYPKEIDVKKPSWFKEYSDKSIKEILKNGFQGLAKQLNLDKYTEKKNALAVRLVDKEGKSFYDAMFQAISGGMPKTLTIDSITNPVDTHVMGYNGGSWRDVSAHEQGTGDYHLGTVSVLVDQQVESRNARINTTSELNTSPVYRLVGTAFDGSAKDTNFWTDSSANGGAVSQDGGYITLLPSAANNGSAVYLSVRRGRFVAGSAMLFVGGFNFVTAATANNVRRFGAYDKDNGFYFELDGTTFSIGSRYATVDAIVSSGSFNGNMGTTWTPTADKFYKFQIEYTPIGVFWYVGNTLLHSISAGKQSATMTLPVYIQSTNEGSTTDVELECIGVYIARQGELVTNSTYYYHALGTTAGVNLKIGAGVLHSIIINNVVNNAVITIADSTTALTPTIFAHTAGDTRVSTTSIANIDAPFNTGLRLYVTAANASLTIIYE